MKILITGGAGFIGINAAKRFLDEGHEVVIFDNMSRKGNEVNLNWLKESGKFVFTQGDVRNPDEIKKCIDENKNIDVVLHLAAQVAVTTSVLEPREDFDINAQGTFNVCEAVRCCVPEAVLLYSSTNKVYGEMTDLGIVEKNGRYEYKKEKKGISEERSLDFHSPYGCSKGTGDQYVIDYSRIYGLKTVTLRQSCIYGPHQFGVEDQGWVAWFTICSVLGQPVTIYGDGKQTRDILHIDDLTNCYIKAIERIEKATGKAYNIGGGPKNILSLIELIDKLETLLGKKIQYDFSDWRPGDQKTFVCDISKAQKDLGWAPNINVEDGIKKIVEWVETNKSVFK